MNKVMELIKSMLYANTEGVYSIVEAKAKTGFNCYNINMSVLDIQAINNLLEEVAPHLNAVHFKPEKYGDVHRLYIGKSPQRKEADVSSYFA